MKHTDKRYEHQLKGTQLKKYGKIPFNNFSFLVYNDSTNAEKISDLNMILKKIGIEFNLEDIDYMDINCTAQRLSISIDYDTFSCYTTRGAGGVQSDEYQEKLKYLSGITIGEIKKMKETTTHTKIIEELNKKLPDKMNISHATYFRAWKNAQSEIDLDKPFFQKIIKKHNSK